MILPTKHLSQDRALLTIGATILPRLQQPLTVSALWEQLSSEPAFRTNAAPLRYDSFVLTLDLLYLIGAIELEDGLLSRTSP
jgi:hypothetical protein